VAAAGHAAVGPGGAAGSVGHGGALLDPFAHLAAGARLAKEDGQLNQLVRRAARAADYDAFRRDLAALSAPAAD
jgi:hypothetical protein